MPVSIPSVPRCCIFMQPRETSPPLSLLPSPPPFSVCRAQVKISSCQPSGEIFRAFVLIFDLCYHRKTEDKRKGGGITNLYPPPPLSSPFFIHHQFFHPSIIQFLYKIKKCFINFKEQRMLLSRIQKNIGTWCLGYYRR